LIFIHGLESTARGVKGRFFSRHFPEMIIEDFAGDFIMRMTKLKNLLADKNNLVMVGSSYGGLMAVQYAMENPDKVKKLILLAPALNLPEFQRHSGKKLEIPVIIYHGQNDEVVDPDLVKKIASDVFAHFEHHLVKDDHPLHETFTKLDWFSLLKSDG